ncbi:accessory gene regulator B family protein [Tannockella kyphosi]|uniref:accessory gene regulator B family protein n=1 Tax=Tannockella kyphosi TaxID=2899121 RepID=UPI0020124140|nr:accessory gene regulator B family protein [Tannockella kyphosi]
MNIIGLSNKLAHKITVSDDLEDIQILRYGIEAIITTTINTALAILVSITCGLFYEFVLFNIIFVPFRKAHKSYHCKTFLQCTICSNILMFLTTTMIHTVAAPRYIYYVFAVLLVINYLVSYEKNLFIHGIMFIAFYIVYCLNSTISFCMFLAVLITILLIILRRLSHEKTI